MDCTELKAQAKESLTPEEYKTLEHLMAKGYLLYQYNCLCKDIDSREIAIPTKLVERKVRLEAQIASLGV